VIRAAWRAALGLLPARVGDRVFQSWVNVLAERRDPDDALRRLLALDDHLQREIDRAAIRYDGGVHAKHRLTAYHDFFVQRVEPGERVLDVGCGKGELALDLAERSGAHVVGVDVSPRYLAFARERSAHESVEYVEADVLSWRPEEPFDVVVLSNVLEHVDDRVGLLRTLVATARPKRLLLRVPVRTRHWQVPLRRELGLEYRSDPQHHVEYAGDELEAELREAGLEPTEVVHAWGEIWAEARPR
jgi:SAM-dependent methyltransferase